MCASLRLYAALQTLLFLAPLLLPLLLIAAAEDRTYLHQMAAVFVFLYVEHRYYVTKVCVILAMDTTIPVLQTPLLLAVLVSVEEKEKWRRTWNRGLLLMGGDRP